MTVAVNGQRDAIISHSAHEKLNLRLDATTVSIAVDETTSEETVEAVWRTFGGTLAYADIEREARDALPAELARTTEFLTHPVFHKHRSETELLRYMRKLADRDLALDRAMIPLGSCTMKLNATTEMIPVTWPAFGALHPFAPREQAAGYQAMFEQLKQWLVDITGYDAISLQPNSGAQGEYAGLLAIRGYHASRGESHRTVCLIPSSAHGTNPATASMVGMSVVVVACDAEGNVDVDDLKREGQGQRRQARGDHDHLSLDARRVRGGDPRDLRGRACAWRTGLSRRRQSQRTGRPVAAGRLRRRRQPPQPAQDLLHSARRRRSRAWARSASRSICAPFLPGHPLLDGGTAPVGPVSAAPYGSASILVISYIYILMMGGDGLQRATEVAILNANYIAEKLHPHFPVLYRNHNNRVAHECIVDPRGLKASGVSVDDIAKRLIDYGFHAPTMSFPVAGTLMIEPTESESKAELDRFCDAMIAIRQGDRRRRARQVDDCRFAAAACAAHRARSRRRRLEAALLARRGLLPGRRLAHRQVLVPGRPRRQRVRRPQSRVLVPAGGCVRGGGGVSVADGCATQRASPPLGAAAAGAGIPQSL